MKNKKISYRNLIILIVAIILLIIIGITITMARYRSTGTTDLDVEISLFVFEEGFQAGNIMLAGLYPRENPFEYEFSVSNTDGTNVAETSLEYNVALDITTNLPLDIKIYKKNANNTYSELTSTDEIENKIVLDESGQNYIRKIKIKNGSFTFSQSKTDIYKLSAVFPQSYSNIEAYEGVIDNASIIVEAKQKI